MTSNALRSNRRAGRVGRGRAGVAARRAVRAGADPRHRGRAGAGGRGRRAARAAAPKRTCGRRAPGCGRWLPVESDRARARPATCWPPCGCRSASRWRRSTPWRRRSGGRGRGGGRASRRCPSSWRGRRGRSSSPATGTRRSATRRCAGCSTRAACATRTLDVGRGRAATFPARLSVALLDRVLVSDEVAVRSVTEHRVPGSDHRAVVAELDCHTPCVGSGHARHELDRAIDGLARRQHGAFHRRQAVRIGFTRKHDRVSRAHRGAGSGCSTARCSPCRRIPARG